MAIFFTGDQHFGHANIIRHCNRPFANAFEMDRCMIARWNERVGVNDTVYIVGDLIFRAQFPPETYLLQLPGKASHHRQSRQELDEGSRSGQPL